MRSIGTLCKGLENNYNFGFVIRYEEGDKKWKNAKLVIYIV